MITHSIIVQEIRRLDISKTGRLWKKKLSQNTALSLAKSIKIQNLSQSGLEHKMKSRSSTPTTNLTKIKLTSIFARKTMKREYQHSRNSTLTIITKAHIRKLCNLSTPPHHCQVSRDRYPFIRRHKVNL